ncbi:MAG TPA: hypothetical protein DHV22_01275, partial [Xanthomarina gelatinilytica]|nr:hypothetical protein [Xanthomarina gelatinilytica]
MRKKFSNNILPIKPILFFLIFIGAGNLFTWSQNDSIVLKNKDKIVGEIKSLDKGVLTVKTDYSDSDFKITWLEVISVR